MSQGPTKPEERQDIALERIAAEREARTGRLDLGNLGLTRVPEGLGDLVWLETLRLGSPVFLAFAPNDIAALAPILPRLTGLRHLDCQGARLGDLGPLAGLSALESLDCSHTQIADLGPLAGLSALRSLKCSATQVTDLGPLAGLSLLESLDCSDTRVADLGTLAGLLALECLYCSATPVTDLGPLAGLSGLEHLSCWFTLVADLRPLAGLSALESLNCSVTEVADLGPLAGLPALEYLNCAYTQVADLGPLTGLPALRDLSCWVAPVTRIPLDLLKSQALKQLVISPHPALAPIPAEVLSQSQRDNCLPRLRAHLKDLETGAGPLRDLKVIVLGNGRIGKTQLCRRLRGQPFVQDADSTHGIWVEPADLPMPEGELPAILNLWDFGGQDLYHGTHALFMRTQAIFLVVWTPESEDGDHEHGGLTFRNRPLAYWLEYVRHLGGAGSPLLLVQTRCDMGRGERANLPVDPDLIRPLEEDGRCLRRLAFSAKDDSGRAGLLEALQQAVRALREAQGQPWIGRNRLVVWDRLRDWRGADSATPDPAARRHRLIPYADFESLCRDQGVHDPETFAEVLHRTGMVWYRPGHFRDRMVLDQSWALGAVYALFTREGGVYGTLRRLGGRFTRPDLDALLWGRQGLTAADQRSLLEMMEQSGVCFVHRRDGHDPDQTEYVAPDLLPDRETLAGELSARWDPIPGGPVEAAFALPFLSPSIPRAVLSDLGGLAADTARYWAYGVSLYDGASHSTAEVESVQDPQGYGGEVRLRAKGAGAQTLVEKLLGRIAELSKRHGWSGRRLGAEAGDGEGRPLGIGHPRVRGPGPFPGLGLDAVLVSTQTLSPAIPPAVPPVKSEVYVSFAWGRERQDPLVGELIETLGTQGIEVQRDSDRLQPGDRISHFMERLSAGRCVVVVLSAAYLRSEYCMTELLGIWRNARQRGDEFLARIVPLVQDDAAIGTPRERIAHAVYWKGEHDELDALFREHGADVIGELDFVRFKLIADYYRHVGDMLALANDVLVSRDRPTLTRDAFAAVRGLIERALA